MNGHILDHGIVVTFIGRGSHSKRMPVRNPWSGHCTPCAPLPSIVQAPPSELAHTILCAAPHRR